MRFTDALGQWVLSQLEFMPAGILRQGAELRASEMIIDHILGQREAEELRAMLDTPTTGQNRIATVLLPGVMGSLLASIRGISSLLWMNPTILSDGHLNLMDLAEDGQHDRSPDVEIVPIGIEKLSYIKLILGLARETRLYEFPFDWRRHVEHNAQLLHQALARWSSASPDRKFNLIGHSLGGIVARTYLALYPDEAEQRVERLILLASPRYGSMQSVLNFSGQTGPTAVVSRLNPANDVIGFISSLPVSYQLLPPPPELFPGDRAYPVNWDLYDARAWGLRCVRQHYLDDARQLYRKLASVDPQIDVQQIVGCHRHTVTDVSCSFDDDFEATAPDYNLVSQETGPDSGDNTVPLWSVSPSQIQTYYIQENHQALPNNDQVIAATIDLVHGRMPDLPQELPEPENSGSRQLPGVGSLMQQVNELRSRIEQGGFTREDLERILFQR